MKPRIPAKILKQLKDALGSNLAYRINDHALDAAGRAAKHVELTAVAARFKDANERMEARRRELLSDPIYRELQASVTELRKARDELAGYMHARKYSVGACSGMFFHVKADGDTWGEVLEKLRAK